MNIIRWRVRIFTAVQNTSQNCKTDKWLFRCRVCSIPRKSENQLICAEDRFFYTIHIRKPIEIFASMRYNVCTHIYFLLRAEEVLMSILGFFKKKADIKPQVEKETAIEVPIQRGVAISKRVELDSHNENSIRNCYIAFDVETTGLSPISDRIVEIGATIFQNGTVQRVFSSLVNPGISISQSASAVNHITNSMLNSAPSEKEVYSQLVDFLGDALCGGIVMCAHNAKFDFDFLCNTLSRLGFNANIEYIDTLSLSRKYLHGLENYKQSTIENYFGLTNPSSHRAASDAENCGHILYRLIDVASESLEIGKRQIEQSKPNLQELEVCAFIQNVISQKGGDTKLLRFRKNSSGYVDVCCLYTFLKVKFAKKGAYILIRSNCPATENYATELCTQSEGGTDYIRVYFSSPFDLEPLSEYIYEAFFNCYKSMEEYASYSNYRRREIENSIRFMCALTNEEVSSLLNEIKEHNYAPITISVANERQISCDDVVIHAVYNRVPLSEIRNADNWDKGFKMGFPHWEKGEDERKRGNLALAIELFDKARLNGYAAPALYTSYALAYRQLKDYSNEIVILDEGISRMPDQASVWSARKAKAISLLFAQQEKERKAAEKLKRQAEKVAQKETSVSVPKKLRGRAILQMDDGGNVIKEFDSIAAAVQEVGVSSKSIRDAANGVQKRAGGYHWMYKE